MSRCAPRPQGAGGPPPLGARGRPPRRGRRRPTAAAVSCRAAKPSASIPLCSQLRPRTRVHVTTHQGTGAGTGHHDAGVAQLVPQPSLEVGRAADVPRAHHEHGSWLAHCVLSCTFVTGTTAGRGATTNRRVGHRSHLPLPPTADVRQRLRCNRCYPWAANPRIPAVTYAPWMPLGHRPARGLRTRLLWTALDAGVWAASLAVALWLRLDYEITELYAAPLAAGAGVRHRRARERRVVVRPVRGGP